MSNYVLTVLKSERITLVQENVGGGTYSSFIRWYPKKQPRAVNALKTKRTGYV